MRDGTAWDWRPDLSHSTGEHWGKQSACSHPLERRLTSPQRRMYCGDCDVSFYEWAQLSPRGGWTGLCDECNGVGVVGYNQERGLWTWCGVCNGVGIVRVPRGLKPREYVHELPSQREGG